MAKSIFGEAQIEKFAFGERTLGLRMLTIGEMEGIFANNVADSEQGIMEAVSGINRRILGICLVDEKGEQVFKDPKDIDKLPADQYLKLANASQEAFKKLQEALGMNDKPAEGEGGDGVKKNSQPPKPEPSGQTSTTPSPENSAKP